MQKVRSKSDTVENLVETKGKTAVKCMSQGVSKAFVLVIVRNKRISGFCLEEVNRKISVMYKSNIFFVDDKNISNIHLFDDGLHLEELGRCILGNDVTDCLIKFSLTRLHHPNIHIHHPNIHIHHPNIHIHHPNIHIHTMH